MSPGINYRGPALAAPINQDQYVARIDHTFNTQRFALWQLHLQHSVRRYRPDVRFRTRGNRARAQNASLTELHVFSSTRRE